MDLTRYRIIIEWSDEDQVYVARAPAFPGCMAHGESIEEAGKEIHIALEAVMESMVERGEDLPPEDIHQDYSGKTNLRMPPFLHEQLARLSSIEGVSLNQLLVTLLAEGVGRKQTVIVKRPSSRKTARKGTSTVRK